MIECFESTSDSKVPASDSVRLDFQQRQKSRGRATTKSGDDVAWFLPRANVLSDGDCLQAKDGTLVQVLAAEESLSEVASDNPLHLMKAAYHLGNRHVPLQIHKDTLSYQHDHVLDAMINGLGLKVVCVNKSFHPESGAYHNQGQHSHGDHSHSHHEHHHAK